MLLRRSSGLAGAREARGVAVVIDVLRAFTTAAFACDAGAREIELVGTPEEGLARKRADPALVLVGEVGGKPIPGFDHGNSPERMETLDLRARTVVLRSSSGVQGALAAIQAAEHVLLGSLVTASATARTARVLGHEVWLVPMGSPAGPDGPEDEACADLLESLLRGERPDLDAVVRGVRASPAGRQALDPAIDWITPGDLERALDVGRFDFALEARLANGRLIARPR